VKWRYQTVPWSYVLLLIFGRGALSLAVLLIRSGEWRQIVVITCNNNCCMNRSSTVGIPSVRTSPPGFSISFRRTGVGT
jgi:hypothetical protein